MTFKFEEDLESIDDQFFKGEVHVLKPLTIKHTAKFMTEHHETLVVDDNDVPNKKYVDDAVGGITIGTGNTLPDPTLNVRSLFSLENNIDGKTDGLYFSNGTAWSRLG
jgi:hypothetical protein